MELTQFAGFLLVSVALSCTPGADWAYVISSALGQRSYRPAVWGLISGYLLHTALLVCGIAALVASSPMALLWLTVAGSFYLLWLGISTLVSFKKAKFYDADQATASSTDKVELSTPVAEHEPSMSGSVAVLTKTKKIKTHPSPFLRGLLTSGTNPKALLLYVALIPQYFNPSTSLPISLQTLILGLTHVGVSIIVYFCVAVTARALLRSRPRVARGVTLCSGIIMVCLALGLIYEQFFVA